jgi:hypothetical protein
MRAADCRIGEPVPLSEDPDAPVRQTLHLSPEAALKISDALRMYVAQAEAKRGRWVELNIIGLRLIPAGMENLVIRGNA